MPTKLFVYGTLLDPWIRRRVLGRARAYRVTPATLRQHQALVIAGEAYPQAARNPGKRLVGRILSGLTPRDLKALDHYEGPDYDRIPIRLFSLSNRVTSAEIYRTKAHVETTNRVWTLRRWKQLGGYRAFLVRRASQ